jgi:DinB family protein
VTHLVARRVSSITRLQKRDQFLHGEAEPHSILDELDPIDDVVRIESVAGSRSQRFWQHALTFVVPNGVGADACTSRRFADGKDIWSPRGVHQGSGQQPPIRARYVSRTSSGPNGFGCSGGRERPRKVFEARDFQHVGILRERWFDMEIEQRAFIETMTPEALLGFVQYVNLQGQTCHYPLWRQMDHVVNHSSYHRGQLTTMLRQLAARPVPTDFLVFHDELDSRPA